MPVSYLAYFLTLKVEAICLFEISVDFHRTVQNNIPVDNSSSQSPQWEIQQRIVNLRKYACSLFCWNMRFSNFKPHTVHTYIVHSFIDPIVLSGPDLELVIKRLDCKETVESKTITNKLRMTKNTYTQLKLPNIVGEIIKHNLGTSSTITNNNTFIYPAYFCLKCICLLTIEKKSGICDMQNYFMFRNYLISNRSLNLCCAAKSQDQEYFLIANVLNIIWLQFFKYLLWVIMNCCLENLTVMYTIVHYLHSFTFIHCF
jgi:hypothetical protein